MLINTTDNVTGKFRKISAIYKPTSVGEIVKIVEDARLSKIPLYPISTGFNWDTALNLRPLIIAP